MKQTGSILVVDDDENIRLALDLALRSLGHNVLLTSDGNEAIELFSQNHHLSLIFLDLMMPNISGAQFRERQKKDPRYLSVPTVIISANENVNEVAKQLGVQEVLKKPININQLKKIVEKYC